jgi:organic radical activating enzyme
MTTDLIISEVFGPTVQGEGSSIGKRCAFVRFGMCNLDCSWCDTPYTWDWKHYDREHELHHMPVEAVIKQVEAMHVSLVVITGGEPLVQRRGLGQLLDKLLPEWAVEVETNGTRMPAKEWSNPFIQWNVSPKLRNSGIDHARAWNLDALRGFEAMRKTRYKFVCRSVDDLDEVAELVNAIPTEPGRVWIMPEGRTVDAITEHGRALAEPAIAAGYNLTTRLHIALWSDQRGH